MQLRRFWLYWCCAARQHGCFLRRCGRAAQKTSVSRKAAALRSRRAQPLCPQPAQSAVRDEAQRLLAGMTLEEKVGQMFLARCPAGDAAQKAAEYHLGGYILFSEDFEGRTPQQAAERIQNLQAAATVPLLIAVDEEGGTVNRISRYPAFRSAPFPSPQQLFQAGGLPAVRADTLDKCAFLQDLGINMNFAPVCDVSTNEKDFIYPRAFGQGAQQTAEYVREAVQAMDRQGVASVLKHFPVMAETPTPTQALRTIRVAMNRLSRRTLYLFVLALRQGRTRCWCRTILWSAWTPRCRPRFRRMCMRCCAKKWALTAW